MPVLPSSHDAVGVAASLLIAFLAAYIALDLARRVRMHDRDAALAWWIGGSVVMGSGIWAMHFLGMLALYYATTLAYSLWLKRGTLVDVMVPKLTISRPMLR